jgi:rieske iron-sulfur protein
MLQTLLPFRRSECEEMDEPFSNAPPQGPGGCCGRRRSTRRDVLSFVSTLGLCAISGTVGATADPAEERPKEGDFLVAFEGESATPLEPKDIPAGGPPLFAWPMDTAGAVVRKGSRLNKVLLLRLDAATLTTPTTERAADGVVAYSAICPHVGCEVSGWDAEQKILECSCHFSHYNPRDAAAIIDGPTTRRLPALPLKIVDGKLAVAKPFTSRVGITPT